MLRRIEVALRLLHSSQIEPGHAFVALVMHRLHDGEVAGVVGLGGRQIALLPRQVAEQGEGHAFAALVMHRLHDGEEAGVVGLGGRQIAFLHRQVAEQGEGHAFPRWSWTSRNSSTLAAAIAFALRNLAKLL